MNQYFALYQYDPAITLVHLRHGERADGCFPDGHVESFGTGFNFDSDNFTDFDLYVNGATIEF